MPSTTTNNARKPASSVGRRRGGEFARPELTTPWEKFTRNLFVRVAAAVVLLGGTGFLTYTAISGSM